jgi:hypothetical protein
MFQDLETKSARRAVWFTLGGAILMVVCYWGFRYFVDIAAVGSAGAPLAIGLTLGMVLFYKGAVRLLIGPKIDAIEVKHHGLLALLYTLGLALCLGSVGWLVVGYFGLDPFGG